MFPRAARPVMPGSHRLSRAVGGAEAVADHFLVRFRGHLGRCEVTGLDLNAMDPASQAVGLEWGFGGVDEKEKKGHNATIFGTLYSAEPLIRLATNSKP